VPRAAMRLKSTGARWQSGFAPMRVIDPSLSRLLAAADVFVRRVI